MTESNSTETRRVGMPVLVFALLLPLVLTFVYFIALADADPGLQQSVFGIGKFIQFALPLFLIAVVLRRRVRPSRPARDGMGLGLGFGLLVGGLMICLYAWVLEPSGALDGPAAAIRAKLEGIGIDTGFKFAVMAVGYSVVHSLMEEYYWRWFVFAELDRHTSRTTAIVVSSLGFMAHHVIVLVHYFGADSALGYLFSIGVAIGGGVWAWLYARSGSLYSPWLSHCLVDAAIFIIGYQLIS